MTSGQCLCGAVRFSLEVEPRYFYRCHCSLCRKQTGVGHNLATLVKADEFRWLAGQALISSWQKPSGYRNDFCSSCGSTVPNPLRQTPYFWIPLGLLDVELSSVCIGDFCTDDAMPWDQHRSPNSHRAAPESLEFILQALQVDAD
ncbi:GFA family protein [Pseudomonas kielensis]|uniref:GFA family protein n=1 Tax=Pseudomonas TaxID=286 RepID=UPI0014135F78|nr:MULTISPECIES: GFA family protein [Pseudomonas]NBB35036.1 S-(hydroxymethyl)glutathione synthase [Pseudomonas sp. BC115LW]UZM15685.1 GFA family protein [Pseudomonas kielensis]WKL52114.1 GFA family protein [Pseudomonas kielensis]